MVLSQSVNFVLFLSLLMDLFTCVSNIPCILHFHCLLLDKGFYLHFLYGMLVSVGLLLFLFLLK